jgi:hypothetical protein
MFLPRFRLGGPAAAAVALSLLLPGAALAATIGVDLRVVNTAGRTLAEHRQYTSTVSVKTDPQANCFGQGTGGSGDRVQVNGATALGAVRDGLAWDGDLRPLSVTDAFLDDGFGLGVCGIGGFESQGSSFWYLKGDHAGSQVSGSQQRVHAGEDVLWYLAPTFPPPPELRLNAPARAQPDVPYQVIVYSYADDGTRSPAAGARVTGAAAPTGAGGRTMVTSTQEGTDTLQATHGRDIPSNRVKVCVDADLSRCPQTHGRRIIGTVRGDEIRSTPGWDAITALGGDDQVGLLAGGRDGVNCGGGNDTVVLRRGDNNDRIAATCERVLRR